MAEVKLFRDTNMAAVTLCESEHGYGHDIFYNVDCLVMGNMYWMSCDFEEAKECTRSLSKQPCYLL